MKKLAKLSRKKEAAAPTRITNDTVAEHRKQVLASGRKFKYPLQYSRHKLVINTIIISVLAVILVGVFGWWQLYPRQNSSTFAYKVTAVVPLPVASVDGALVRYSDYLLTLRSAEHYLRQKEQTVLNAEDGQRQIEYLKRQSLRSVIADAYAGKLAQDLSVSVSDEELSDFLKSKRQIDGSETSERIYHAVIRDYYDWSPDEYAHVMRAKLLQQKVAFAVDDTAKATAAQLEKLAKATESDASLKTVLEANASSLKGATYGVSGMVPRANQDGGLAAAAAGLKKGEKSGIIQSTADGKYHYAIVRLLDSNKTQVSYEFIVIPVEEFQSRLDALYKDEKVKMYIDVSLKEEGKDGE